MATQLNEEHVPITVVAKLDITLGTKVTLENVVNGVRKKADIMQINSLDPEALIRGIEEFKDISQPARLNFDTGELLFEKLRELLSSIVRTEWDQKCEDLPETIEGFEQALERFIRVVLDEEAYEEQKNFLR
jgi:hypothetical protein